MAKATLLEIIGEGGVKDLYNCLGKIGYGEKLANHEEVWLWGILANSHGQFHNLTAKITAKITANFYGQISRRSSKVQCNSLQVQLFKANSDLAKLIGVRPGHSVFADGSK